MEILKLVKLEYKSISLLFFVIIFNSCTPHIPGLGWKCSGDSDPDACEFPIINIIKFVNDTCKDYVCRSLCDFNIPENYETFVSRDTITFNVFDSFLNQELYITDPYRYLTDGYYLVNWRIHNHFVINMGVYFESQNLSEVLGEYDWKTDYFAKCNLTTTNVKWSELNSQTNNEETLLHKQNYPIISEYKIITKSQVVHEGLSKKLLSKAPDDIFYTFLIHQQRDKKAIKEYDEYYFTTVKEYLIENIKKGKLEEKTKKVELLQ